MPLTKAECCRILRVPTTSTVDEIKRAYRQLALRYHPDRNSSPQDGERFKEITAAYKELMILMNRTDPIQQRREKPGTRTAPNTGRAPGSSAYCGSHSRPRRPQVYTMPSAMDYDSFMRQTDEEFRNLFNDGQFATHECNGRAHSATVDHEIHATLEELYMGFTKRLKVTTNAGETTVDVVVPAGWPRGKQLTHTIKGSWWHGWKDTEIVVAVYDKPHRIFKREGCDIRYVHKISAASSICGASIDIPTLDGGSLRRRIEGPIVAGTVKRIRGQGLPNPEEFGRRGDFLIEFGISFGDGDYLED